MNIEHYSHFIVLASDDQSGRDLTTAVPRTRRRKGGIDHASGRALLAKGRILASFRDSDAPGGVLPLNARAGAAKRHVAPPRFGRAGSKNGLEHKREYCYS